MLLVFLALAAMLLLFGLVLVIRARGWVRLLGAIQMAVVLSPIGLFIWWQRWGSGYADVLLTASPVKTVSIMGDTGQTMQVASGTPAHRISESDTVCGTRGGRLIRIGLTEGEHRGMTAWVCSENVRRRYGLP
jgi:hypothetical protein